jgi:hypothetical protein
MSCTSRPACGAQRRPQAVLPPSLTQSQDSDLHTRTPGCRPFCETGMAAPTVPCNIPDTPPQLRMPAWSQRAPHAGGQRGVQRQRVRRVLEKLTTITVTQPCHGPQQRLSRRG